ncbi:hypothetical protein E2320_003290 [Naja naja]|nr:hypothetical protein E2320_003290 [Naja naja]
MGVRLFETSAKENLNVEEMFNAITAMVLRMKQENLARRQQQNEVVKSTSPKRSLQSRNVAEGAAPIDASSFEEVFDELWELCG